MTNKRVDIDALIKGDTSIDEHDSSGFIKSPLNKEMPHPSLYFKELFLISAASAPKKITEGMDIAENFFFDFLKQKVDVNIHFAQKLTNFTGMPCDFWLRAQYRYDNVAKVNKVDEDDSIPD